MRLLLTGGRGFVGGHVIRALSRQSDVDLLHVTAKEDAADGIHSLDITDTAAVESCLAEVKPTHVLHLAGISTVAGSHADPSAAWQVNTLATLGLGRAILRTCPDCTLLFAGSSETYGATAKSGQPMTEASVLAPLNEYAATKAAADLGLGALAHDGLRVIRMRPFNHTGPGQTRDFVIPAFASQIAEIELGLKPAELSVGNLDARRDFLDVRDVVAGYMLAMHRSADIAPGTIINFASGTPRRIGDILAQLLTLTGKAITVTPDPKRQRPNELPVAVGSADFSRQLLGWAPAYAFEQTLADVLDFWRTSLTHSA